MSIFLPIVAIASFIAGFLMMVGASVSGPIVFAGGVFWIMIGVMALFGLAVLDRLEKIHKLLAQNLSAAPKN